MLPSSRLYRLVRQFAVSVPTWSGDAIRYQTLPDEEYDLTLVSQRVYGNRGEYLAVMAAAGLDSFNQRLEQQTIILPSSAKLEQLKRDAGFVGAVS